MRGARWAGRRSSCLIKRGASDDGDHGFGSRLRRCIPPSTLKRGQQRVYLHPGLPADPAQPSTTPSTAYQADERARLERLVRQYERGDVPRVEWMDALAFRRIERIHAVSARIGREGGKVEDAEADVM